MARLPAAELGMPFVHISTDYVFDGARRRARTRGCPDCTARRLRPLEARGGGRRCAAGGRHAILRTSWVVSAHGANFVKTMLRVGPERDKVRVVNDQIGGPTPARDIAAACMVIAATLARDPATTGTYHFAGAPDTSWAAFAKAIFETAGLDVPVEEIPTTEYPLPAPRPLNSRLDCSATEAVFGIPRPDWRAGLAQILSDLSPRGDAT
jgi:dTDP-4-dehydrorhamnose reductase